MDRFMEELIRELNIAMKGVFSLVPVKAPKNNDITLSGIRFDRKGEKVSPVVYVDDYYKAYVEGIATMETIMVSIIKQLTKTQDVDAIVRRLHDYELIKHELAFALVNYDINREILKERLHKKFLDLAAVCLVRVVTDDGANGIVYVTHNMLKVWKIDEDTLFEQCMKNTVYREKHEILDIRDVVEKMSVSDEEEFGREMLVNILGEDRKYMFVLTNETRHMGANALLNQNILHNFAMEHDSNLIIYPSSLHEVIIVFEEDFKAGCMDAEMVKMINEEQVYREEWLSNSVYMYDRELEKLVVYQQGEPLCSNVEAERMAS